VPFPTVKSDPWKKRRPRPRHVLWPASGWKRLCAAANQDWHLDGVREVGRRAFAVIRELNAECG